MIEYGLITRIDANVLEKTIDLVCQDFVTQELHITEIGSNEWRTARGVIEYVKSKGRFPVYTGIDNFKDANFDSYLPKIDGSEIRFIGGNSSEVYNEIPDNSQHILFVDGCHTFPAVIADYFCYKEKVRIDGYLVFHDTASHIKPFTDWQRVGDKKDPDMYISVRKALQEVCWGLEFKLVFDEADPLSEAGGMMVLKRVQ